jgi:hypothetical protein
MAGKLSREHPTIQPRAYPGVALIPSPGGRVAAGPSKAGHTSTGWLIYLNRNKDEFLIQDPLDLIQGSPTDHCAEISHQPSPLNLPSIAGQYRRFWRRRLQRQGNHHERLIESNYRAVR